MSTNTRCQNEALVFTFSSIYIKFLEVNEEDSHSRLDNSPIG